MKKYYVFILALAFIATVAGAAQVSSIRKKNDDQARVQDIGRIQDAVRDYSRENGRLPESMTKLGQLTLKLPADEYTYKAVSGHAFEVCAIFTTDNSSEYSSPDNRSPYSHKAGKDCFKEEVYSLKPMNKTFTSRSLAPSVTRNGYFLSYSTDTTTLTYTPTKGSSVFKGINACQATKASVSKAAANLRLNDYITITIQGGCITSLRK